MDLPKQRHGGADVMLEPPSTRIGMLTPSSNTVLEPMTSAILAGVPAVTSHFSRLRVTEISAEPEALAQFNLTPMLDAASLLADARPQAIIWNGTSGGWVGLEADRHVAGTLQRRFDIAVSTVALALVGLMRAHGMRSFGLVTPYVSDIQAKIVANFASEGFTCLGAPHLGISENFAFSQVSVGSLDRLVAEAASRRPDVIIPFCTNLPATPHAARWEAEHGIPIFDSIAIAARAGLELSGLAPRVVKGWGRVFEL